MIRYVAFKLSVIAILLAMGLLSSCQVHVSTSEDWVVDGTHLDERHQEALSVDSWHPEGLTLHGHAGDVTVRWTSASAGDSDRIVATVHEETPGDASLRYERGVLEVLSASGREVALGEVEVVLSRPLSRLEVVTGAGDVEVEDADVEGAIRLSTGAGDVSLKGGRAGGRVSVSSGVGDVDVRDFEGPAFDCSTGMGDCVVRDVTAGDTDLSTGLGDIRVKRSGFDRLHASTGLGDVVASGSTVTGSQNLSSGLGEVRSATRLSIEH